MPLQPAQLRHWVAARVAADSEAATVALGVLTRPSGAEPSPWGVRLPVDLAWRWVTTHPKWHGDPRFAVVPCPDGSDVLEARGAACFCKSSWWFRRALVLYPRASFIGKVEDTRLPPLSCLPAAHPPSYRPPRRARLI